MVGDDFKKVVSDMNDTWQKVPEVFFEMYKIKTGIKPYRVIDLSYNDLK
jgi:hypothetical protein